MKFASLAVAAVLFTASAPAMAVECATGPEGNLCKAENGDPRAMYLVGRRAYVDGLETESGDLTDAFYWAARSKEGGFLGGKMLLKMVYIQMGEGSHHDYVQAHVWLTNAINGGDDYLVAWRKRLEYRMTDEQVAEAVNQAVSEAD
jgi:TPR repeat protein